MSNKQNDVYQETTKEVREEMTILTDKEIKTIGGMSQYWEEVRGRQDKSPLNFELQEIHRMFGVRILWMLSDYIKMLEVLNPKEDIKS